jgi:GT2 family glycosyltransferase
MDQNRSQRHITLVIATHKRPEALATLLSCLRRQTAAPSEVDVAVVVDGVDECAGRYREIFDRSLRDSPFPVRYEFQANAGQSVARHRAIAGASTPWICVVDDDMELLPNFIAEHLAALQEGTSKTVAIGRVIPEEGWENAPLYEAAATSHMLEWQEAMARGLREPRGHKLVTQNVSFAKEFYQVVGGFDEKLRLGEDTELGLRFEFAGARFVFAEKAAAIHHSRVGSYDVWQRRCVEYGKNAVYIYEKLGSDARAHPLRDLVNGSRLNAAAVHALCWSETLAHGGIGALRLIGGGLRRIGIVGPAIATHKAIRALAYHLGVKRALGSWPRVMRAKRAFAVAAEAPRDPT